MTPIISIMFAQSTRAPKESGVTRDEKTFDLLTKCERLLADYQRDNSAGKSISRMKSMTHIVDLLAGAGLGVSEVITNRQFYTDWVDAVTIVYGQIETSSRASDVVSHLTAALQFAGSEASSMTAMVAGRIQQAADYCADGKDFAAQGLVKELCAVHSDDVSTLYSALGMIHADIPIVLALSQYIHAEYAVTTALEKETADTEE